MYISLRHRYLLPGQPHKATAYAIHWWMTAAVLFLVLSSEHSGATGFEHRWCCVSQFRSSWASMPLYLYELIPVVLPIFSAVQVIALDTLSRMAF